MIHNLFKQEVQLEPISHKYYDSMGNRYMGFTELYTKLVDKFDAHKVAGFVSKGSNQSADEIRQSWNNKTELGTRIDKALELYAQTAVVLENDWDLKELVPLVLEKYKIYNKTFEQVSPFSKEYRVTGSMDKLALVSNRKDSRFVLSDFKVFEKGVYSLYAVKGKSWLNDPFSHLSNTKYTKISFQLSFYAYLFECLTGRKCERLFIDLIVPKLNEEGRVLSFENNTIPVIYMKKDIEFLLNHFRKEIMRDVDVTEIIFTETEKIYSEESDIF